MKHCAAGMRTWVWIPSTHIESWIQWRAPIIPGLGGEDWKVSVAHWLTLTLKVEGWQSGGWHPRLPPASTYMSTNVYLNTCSYTYKNAHTYTFTHMHKSFLLLAWIIWSHYYFRSKVNDFIDWFCVSNTSLLFGLSKQYKKKSMVYMGILFY